MPKIHYDQEAEILSIKLLNKKSFDSSMHRNIVLDYDKQGNLVNIDIMNFKIEELLKKPREKSRRTQPLLNRK
jgi:uncharacterized protein YuzE